MKYSEFLTGDYKAQHYEVSLPDLPAFCSSLLPLQRGTVIYLLGDLGSGKTTLSRELIRQLCQEPELLISSPTFTLLQQYVYKDGVINHLDLYRLEKLNDVLAIGYDDLIEQGVTLVEWPHLLIAAGYKPDLLLELEFAEDKPDRRKAKVVKF